MHFNRVWPKDAPRLDEARLREGVYALLARYGGSFCAEHGVGPQLQAAYLAHTAPELLALSGRLQAMFDPQGVLGLTDWGPAENFGPAPGSVEI